MGPPGAVVQVVSWMRVRGPPGCQGCANGTTSPSGNATICQGITPSDSSWSRAAYPSFLPASSAFPSRTICPLGCCRSHAAASMSVPSPSSVSDPSWNVAGALVRATSSACAERLATSVARSTTIPLYVRDMKALVG